MILILYLKIDCSTPAKLNSGIPIKRTIIIKKPTSLSVVKVIIKNERSAQITYEMRDKIINSKR